MNQLWALLSQRHFWGRLRLRKRSRKLRFNINQAAAFSQGVDCRKSVVTITVDVEELNEEQRRLIQDRLLGIDVCEGVVRADGSRGPQFVWERDTYEDPHSKAVPCRLVADLPTLASLLEAVMADEERLQEQMRFRQQLAAA